MAISGFRSYIAEKTELVSSGVSAARSYVAEKPDVVISGVVAVALIAAAIGCIVGGAHLFNSSLQYPSYAIDPSRAWIWDPTILTHLGNSSSLLAFGGVLAGLGIATAQKTFLLHRKHKQGSEMPNTDEDSTTQAMLSKWMTRENCAMLAALAVGIALFVATLVCFTHFHRQATTVTFYGPNGWAAGKICLSLPGLKLMGLFIGTAALAYGGSCLNKKVGSWTELSAVTQELFSDFARSSSEGMKEFKSKFLDLKNRCYGNQEGA